MATVCRLKFPGCPPELPCVKFRQNFVPTGLYLRFWLTAAGLLADSSRGNVPVTWDDVPKRNKSFTEYAYRYGSEYDFVWWVAARLADTSRAAGRSLPFSFGLN